MARLRGNVSAGLTSAREASDEPFWDEWRLVGALSFIVVSAMTSANRAHLGVLQEVLGCPWYFVGAMAGRRLPSKMLGRSIVLSRWRAANTRSRCWRIQYDRAGLVALIRVRFQLLPEFLLQVLVAVRGTVDDGDPARARMQCQREGSGNADMVARPDGRDREVGTEALRLGE
jgi:hypothetical protein